MFALPDTLDSRESPVGDNSVVVVYQARERLSIVCDEV